MTSIAVLLVLASALVHVGWNLVGKRENPSASFFLLANALGALALSPVLIWKASAIAAVPEEVWWILLVTGGCQAAYCVSLAAGYRAGDLSIVYPIARSLPPILVLLVAIPLGRAEAVSVSCRIGVASIVIGGLLLPMARFQDFRWSDYVRAGFGFALLAAIATAGYSLLDDHGLRLLRELPTGGFAVGDATLVYLTLESWTTILFLGLYVLARRPERNAFRLRARESLPRAAVVGAGMYVSFGLALAAMAYVADVTYVVAFRQLSVPLGAAVGILFLREASTSPKLVGVAFMSVGLVAVAVG